MLTQTVSQQLNKNRLARIIDRHESLHYCQYEGCDNILHRHTATVAEETSSLASITDIIMKFLPQYHNHTEGDANSVDDIVSAAVDALPKSVVCGQGHATRIVNGLKSLLLARAAALRATPLLLTQADLGEQALAFWARQGLREGQQASRLVRALAAENPKEHLMYDHTLPWSLKRTVIKEMVRLSFGGREVYPYSYMIGRDNFNAEMLEAELWTVKDFQAIYIMAISP